MNTAGLSLNNIPELRIPMGFFITAPGFGMLAALLLVYYPEALESRWHPAMLSAVHLLTLGFAAMIMIGALIQVLPVVSSQPVPGAARISPWVRAGLTTGTLLLATGFLSAQGLILAPALVILAATFLLLISAVGWALIRAGVGDSVLCLRLAAACLLVTILFGLFQLSTYLGLKWVVYAFERTDHHALLGLAGWGLLLVMGISFQVIPMFHVAPAYPRWFCRTAPILIALTLAGLMIGPLAGEPYLRLLLACLVAGYGIVSLLQLSRRKRKLVDYTVRFWQLAFSHLIGISILYGLGLLGFNIAGSAANLHLFLAFAFGIGFIVSVMLGMLQKIVPFLMYLHLQRACLSNPAAFMTLPNMKELLPTRLSRIQFRLHLATLGGFYAAIIVGDSQPLLVQLACLIMFADFGWLLRTLLSANKQYRAHAPDHKATRAWSD